MKTTLLAILILIPINSFADEAKLSAESGLSPETPAILSADQADNRIRLFDPLTPGNKKATLWCYPGDDEKPHPYKPTDAKRVEWEGVVYVLAAYHGRVQLIRFSDQKLIKDYASYRSCHSAELLPDGAIVTANSNDGMLRVHHSEQDFFDLKLPYAHGVTWDNERNCLWALGDFLYRIKYAEGKLAIEKKFKLPLSPTGHDLFPMRQAAKLLVSNNDALFLFDIATEEFELISDLKYIKSASEDTDGAIWVSEHKQIKGAAEWQSDTLLRISSENNKQRYTRENARFYKARWWQPVKFSY